jgi:hypothetical protein
MKSNELPERLKDLAIMYMNEQGKKVTKDSTLDDIVWDRTNHHMMFSVMQTAYEGQLPSFTTALKQLRTIYPNDQEFGAVVAKLFLL